MQSNVNLVKDIILEKLLQGEAFSVSDIVTAFAKKQGRSLSQVAADSWDSIRTCVREMREEFINVDEFQDSSGMPYDIPRYKMTKLQTHMCPEPINVYHPDNMPITEIKLSEVDHAPKWPTQEEAEQMVTTLINKIDQHVTQEPKKIDDISLNEDGSLTIPAEIMNRVGNLQVADPILCLKVMPGLFNHVQIMD